MMERLPWSSCTRLLGSNKPYRSDVINAPTSPLPTLVTVGEFQNLRSSGMSASLCGIWNCACGLHGRSLCCDTNDFSRWRYSASDNQAAACQYQKPVNSLHQFSSHGASGANSHWWFLTQVLESLRSHCIQPASSQYKDAVMKKICTYDLLRIRQNTEEPRLFATTLSHGWQIIDGRFDCKFSPESAWSRSKQLTDF